MPGKEMLEGYIGSGRCFIYKGSGIAALKGTACLLDFYIQK